MVVDWNRTVEHLERFLEARRNKFTSGAHGLTSALGSSLAGLRVRFRDIQVSAVAINFACAHDTLGVLSTGRDSADAFQTKQVKRSEDASERT